MTPLPKRRWSTHRQGKKRATLRLKLPSVASCSNCHALTPTHRTCLHCGYYKGQKVK